MKLPRYRGKVTRDSVLFVFGILGIVYETLIEHSDRPTLLVLFGACIGLPAFLRTDEAQTKKVDAAVVREADTALDVKAAQP